MHRMGIAGLIALIATPAIALAANPQKPAAGTWSDVPNQTNVAPVSFVVASSRTELTSLSFSVQSQATNPGCPTGSVTVPEPLGLEEYTFTGTRPFWAFGRVVAKSFKEAPVRATLDGKPLKGGTLTLEFDLSNIGGVNVEISGGTFSFNAHCGVTLGEGEHS
jgi:hypothetical protein